MLKNIDTGVLILLGTLAASLTLIAVNVAVPLALIGLFPSISLTIITAALYLRRSEQAERDAAVRRRPTWDQGWRSVASHAVWTIPGFAVLTLLMQLGTDAGLGKVLGITTTASAVDWLWLVGLMAAYDTLISFGPARTRTWMNALFT